MSEQIDPVKAKRLLEAQAERESLSFQSLVQQFGDVTAPQGHNPQAAVPTQVGYSEDIAGNPHLNNAPGFFGGTATGDALPQASRKAPDPVRVLGESGGKKTPVWVQAFLSGGLALLLLLPIVGGSGFMAYQPYYSYCVVFLAGSTLFWAVCGLLLEEELAHRLLCLIPTAMALVAGVAAWILRAPPKLI